MRHKTICGATHDDIGVFFFNIEIIRTGFPLLFPGTSDPFKNRIKLSLSAAHVLVKFRAMPTDFANIFQKKKETS